MLPSELQFSKVKQRDGPSKKSARFEIVVVVMATVDAVLVLLPLDSCFCRKHVPISQGLMFSEILHTSKAYWRKCLFIVHNYALLFETSWSQTIHYNDLQVINDHCSLEKNTRLFGSQIFLSALNLWLWYESLRIFQNRILGVKQS